MKYKRVLINLPEGLLDEIDRAAKFEQRKRSEFVREALRDRVAKHASDRTGFRDALAQIRGKVKTDYSEGEVDQDIAIALAEVRGGNRPEPGS